MIAGRLKAAMIVDWTHSWIGERNPKLLILWDENAAHTRYSCWSLTHHCFWISADFGWEILIWMLLEVFCHLLSKNLDVIVINSFVLVMIILYAGTKKVHFDENTYSDNWILTILRSLRRNYVDFLYKNLESLLCIIVACLFLVMTASRVQAESGPVCLSSYLHIEKNATSVTTHICLILQKKWTLVLFCRTLVLLDLELDRNCRDHLLYPCAGICVSDLCNIAVFYSASSDEAIKTSGTIFNDHVCISHPLIFLLFLLISDL